MTSSGRLRWAGQGRVTQEEGPGLAVRLGKPLSPASFPEQETRPRAQGLSQSSSLLTNTDSEEKPDNPVTGPGVISGPMECLVVTDRLSVEKKWRLLYVVFNYCS